MNWSFQKSRLEFRVWTGFVSLKAASNELGEFYYHLHDYHLNKIPFRFYLLVFLVKQLRIIQSRAFPRSTTKNIVCFQVYWSAVCWWLHLMYLNNRPKWHWVSPHMTFTMSVSIIERIPACIYQQLKLTKAIGKWHERIWGKGRMATCIFKLCRITKRAVGFTSRNLYPRYPFHRNLCSTSSKSGCFRKQSPLLPPQRIITIHRLSRPHCSNYIDCFIFVVPCIVILGWRNSTRCNRMQIFTSC